MKPNDLDVEYSTKAARVTAQRHAQQQQRINAERHKQAEPLASREDLSSAVGQLAEAWGLKPKRG